MKITKDLISKILSIVDAGLRHGAGNNANPGEVCVEQAVCMALGEPFSDNPSCVGSAVRAFKIALNDSKWSSNEARAKGMRKLAVAQLGSNTIDQVQFVKRLAVKCCNRIVPIALRAAAKLQEPGSEYIQKLEAAALVCEGAADESAASAAWSAASAASAAKSAAKSAKSAARSAESAESAAVNAARSAESTESTASTARSAESAASAAWSAASAANEYDRVLTVIADAALEVLIELGSPGTKWLNLCA